jgi:hypothetical protein
MPRNKKARFFQQINLANGKKLDFKELSAEEFQSIETLFNRFMKN